MGITWAFVNAIFPNVKVISKAAVAAIVIGHRSGVLRVELETEWASNQYQRSFDDDDEKGGEGKLYWDRVIVKC